MTLVLHIAEMVSGIPGKPSILDTRIFNKYYCQFHLVLTMKPTVFKSTKCGKVLREDNLLRQLAVKAFVRIWQDELDELTVLLDRNNQCGKGLWRYRQ